MKKNSARGGRREGSGRKKIHPEGTTQAITVRVPEVLVNRVDVVAAQDEKSRSEVVSDAIRTYLDERDKKPEVKPKTRAAR